MRTFIGIRISEEIKKNFLEITGKLSSKTKEARIVPPENLHITLKFLGNVETSCLANIKDILSNICGEFEPFDMQVKGLGVFPEQKQLRVLWIGVKSNGYLKSLNRKIEEEFEKLGFPNEKRFKEHITISRFRSLPNLSVINNLMDRFSEHSFGVMNVEGVELIESVLTSSSPPVYKTLFHCPFL
ncbi:RNA 2',3'-cyclic phosphodiesterase [bacterium]|nr:RNA 2',3'-cyclic phosphodiesterase [bacterium]